KYLKIEEKDIDLNHLDLSVVDQAFTSTGRSAISLALNNLDIGKDKIALLPSYLCESMLEPFLMAEYSVYFYSINEDLTVNEEEIITLAKKYKPSILLALNYFGFNTLNISDKTIEKL